MSKTSDKVSILRLLIFTIILFTLSTISSSNIQAQQNFRVGYIITLKNDTVFGFIDYRSDIKNSAICTFKLTEDSELVTYLPGEIKAYRFTESKYFISKEFQINNEYKNLFLEYILDGIADLYYYRDIEGDHYLIKRDSVEFLELTNDAKLIYVEGWSNAYWRNNRHIGLLKASFADCLEIQNELNTAKLNHKSLINLTKKYHDYVCDGEECVIYQKDVPGIQLSIAPTIGMNISTLNFSLVQFYSNLNFSKSYGPSIGVRVNMLLPRINEKISIQFESDYSKTYYYSFHKSGNQLFLDSYEVYINANALNSSISIQYKYPKGNIRPTFSLGGKSLYLFNTETKSIHEQFRYGIIDTDLSDDVPIHSYLFGGIGALGVEFHHNKKRIWFTDIHLNYYERNRPIASIQSMLLGIKIGMYL